MIYNLVPSFSSPFWLLVLGILFYFSFAVGGNNNTNDHE